MSVKQVFNTSAELDYPTVLPTLDLDFANSKTLDPRITFTRASGGSYVGADGLIKYAGVNEARFDHDPVTGESLGLLVEEARSNTIPYSEDFSRSDWVTFGTASKSSNVITAPDGNPTADSITIPTSSGVIDNIAASPNTTYTFSSYIKGTPGTTVRILLNFNVSGFTSKTVTVSDVWQRFNVTVTSGASDANVSVQYDAGNGNTFYVWGAQLEAGAFPTSYIPTIGSTRTRAADNASITGKNFSEWYRQDESTIYCEFNAYNLMSTFIRTIFSIDGPEPLGLNRIQLNLNGSGGGGTTQPIYHNLYQNGPNYTDYLGIPYVKGPIKTTMRYKDKDTFMATASNIFARNNNPSLQSIPLTKTMTSLNIGQFTGAISRITYFPKAIPQSQLLSLTS